MAPAGRIVARARRIDLARRRPCCRARAGSHSREEPGEPHPGAIVIGGDYQGLGIVRSLGRRGVDVVVIDDERSISRHSRYVAGAYRFPDLRTDEQTVGALLSVAERRDVEGWVVYPDARGDRRRSRAARPRLARALSHPDTGLVGDPMGMGQAKHLRAAPPSLAFRCRVPGTSPPRMSSTSWTASPRM